MTLPRRFLIERVVRERIVIEFDSLSDLERIEGRMPTASEAERESHGYFDSEWSTQQTEYTVLEER